MADLKINLNNSLQLRIAHFKSDPEKMFIVNEFLNGIYEEAQKEAELRNAKNKSKLDALGIHNGTRRIGQWSSRARTQARTIASRVFTTICNCTNSVRNAVNRNN